MSSSGSDASLLVFDLDGTLIDGYAAIGEALAFAMENLGIPPLPLTRVRGMVGHGLELLVEKAVGTERTPEGVRLFREKYRGIAVEKTVLMPEVPEVLSQLASDGYRMAVASNKPAEFSKAILDSHGVGGYFLAIGGPDAQTPAKPNPEMLRRLMENASRGPAETTVIGDMEVDFEFARAASCRVVLVSAGSRTRDELSALPADALLERLSELPPWLARQRSTPNVQFPLA